MSSETLGTRLAWSVAAALLAGASYVLARFIQLGPKPGPWAYWPIVGILCGIFFRRPTREWWGIGLAAAFGQSATIWAIRGNLAGGATVWGAVFGVIEAMLAAWVLRRGGAGDAPLGRPRDFAAFVVGAVCLVPLAITPVSALGFSLGLHLPFRTAWWPLFVGNSLSILLFAPLAAQRWRRPSGEKSPWTAGPIEVPLCQLCIVLLSVLTFAGPEHWLRYVALPYVMFPLLAWSALRCGPLWTAVAILGLATVSGFCTARAHGPFAPPGLSLEQQVLGWQAYLAFVSFTALLLSALTEQRRRAFENLALQGAIQQAVFESSSALIALQDPQGRLVLVNTAAEAALGRPREQLLGRRIGDFLSAPDAALFAHHDQRVLERGEPLTFDETVQLAGGTRHLVTTRFPVRGQDGNTCFLGLFGRDDTVERELSGRLQRTSRVELLGQLAAGLAHDLNNLLTVIVGNTGFLREREGLKPDEAELIDEVGGAGERAVQLTRRLLSLGRTTAAPRAGVVVDEVVRALEPLLRAFTRGNIDLSTDLRAGGATVVASRTELEQVILNLVSNARDAVADLGRISISTRLVPRAEVPDLPDGARDAEWVRVSVSDTGSGMDAATLGRLFEPFFTTKPETKGTGLGLFTTSLLVREGGGVIRATSAPGEGTTFVVDLPRVVPEPA